MWTKTHSVTQTSYNGFYTSWLSVVKSIPYSNTVVPPVEPVHLKAIFRAIKVKVIYCDVCKLPCTMTNLLEWYSTDHRPYSYNWKWKGPQGAQNHESEAVYFMEWLENVSRVKKVW